MVNRVSIKCATCGKIHTLRISVGHSPYQEHHFKCIQCREEIIVGLEVDKRHVRTELKLVENCELSDSEGAVVNLHPEYTVPEDQVHKDGVFPWLRDFHTVIDAQKKWLPENYNEEKHKNWHDYRDLLLSIESVPESWMKLKKGWSLYRNGQDDLSIKVLQEYKSDNFKESPSLENVLFHFCSTYLAPKNLDIFKTIYEFSVGVAQQNNISFSKFRSYYRKSLKTEHMDRYFDIFSDYFKNFSEYNQLMIYQKFGIPTPEGQIVTSSAFKRTKMFYGDAFEALTSNFTTIACLGNIFSGREFDTFEKMDLKTYLTINKANRSKPFENLPEFKSFIDCVDSTLRNASHHSSMNIDNKNNIIYRSGGTGAKRSMSYSEYLCKCNKIMFNIVALLMLELTIAHSD